MVSGTSGEGSGARSVAVCVAGAVFAGASTFSATGEGRRTASGCGADCAVWGIAGTLLRQGRSALDLGAAPGELCVAGGAVPRAAGEDGVRYGDLPETA